MSMRTLHTRLELIEEDEALLDGCAEHFSHIEHALFVDLQKQESSVNELKKAYIKRFKITARQFNSIRVSVEGKMASLKEVQKQQIADVKEALVRVYNRLSSGRLSDSKRRGCFKRKQRLESKLKRLKEDQEAGRVRLCFGSRKLFRAQFQEDSSYESHEEWLAAWQDKRNGSFFLMGSKDETSGNQTCTGSIDEAGNFSFRIRLPNGLSESKYLVLSDISFGYGHELIKTALQECALRQQLYKEKDPNYQKHGVAISYRFCRDEKGWRFFVSFSEPQPEYVTNPELGYIGIDLNIDHLAVAETDRFGNLIGAQSLPLCLYGKTKEQTKAFIGDIAKEVVAQACSSKKPIVLEKLDFQAKKRTLAQTSPKFARMLSSFAYNSIREAIKARAYREGVHIIEVDPAYTSQIGKIKFAKRYGLSTHHAAALCIARRAAKFSETLPRQTDVYNGKGAYVAFVVPVRNQQRSFYAYLREVVRKFRVVLAEHTRVTKCQSIGPPGSV